MYQLCSRTVGRQVAEGEAMRLVLVVHKRDDPEKIVRRAQVFLASGIPLVTIEIGRARIYLREEAEPLMSLLRKRILATWPEKSK